MREQIIQATMMQIYKFGFRKFTVDDLATDLGISKKTLYKYFKSKDELISTVIDDNIKIDQERTSIAVEEETTWLGKLRAAILFHHHDKISADLMDELHRFFPEEWMKFRTLKEFKLNMIRELLLEGMNRGEIRSDISIELVLVIVEKSVLAVFEHPFLRREFSINQAIDAIEQIIFYGITSASKNN